MDAYSKLPILYRTGNVNTKEFMYKLYIFQAKFGKVDEFGWCDMKRIKNDSGTQCNSKEF